ncbi:structural protein P5 [Bacteroidales bacterium OttesenSCG-928-C19]|nr:structural protein P5 [Bacteroidales bacterium OttesenSCG-928-C19]
MARGLRNNNPGNIRHSVDKFQGETLSNDKSFKTFVDIEHGYRAIFIILSNYLKNGFNTIEKIITRWAPPVENSTQAYINTVCQRSGISRSERLTTKDGEKYIKIVEAISFVENGAKPDLNSIEKGFKLQTKITR